MRLLPRCTANKPERRKKIQNKIKKTILTGFKTLSSFSRMCLKEKKRLWSDFFTAFQYLTESTRDLDLDILQGHSVMYKVECFQNERG